MSALLERNRPPFLSGINPNSSSSNLTKINGFSDGGVQHPKPNKRINLSNHFGSFQMPITPPVLNSLTPINETKSFPLSKSFSSLLVQWLPPVDVRVTVLCLCWYVCLIVSNNLTKMVLSQFQYPVTLTQFQFLMNSIFLVVLMAAVTSSPSSRAYFPKGVLPPPPQAATIYDTIKSFLTPTTLIINTTLPMGCFQFVGHITSHKATSLIPVSLVHTIKALSPLMTVLIYRTFYRIKYKKITYVTLVPLVIGIMLTCFKKKKNAAPGDLSFTMYLAGLGYAFVLMLIFVLQNIFAKKRLTIEKQDKILLPTSNSTSLDKKVDKLTILFFCLMIGFCLTMPVYLISEFTNESFSLGQVTPYILTLVCINGASHFLQTLLAFQILGAMSPINYSIANILKRIIIILIAFVWENKNFSQTQGAGLALTMVGLYCYDRWGTTHK